MAYSITESISGQTGNIGLLTIGVLPSILDLFSGDPQHYSGSIIQVRETIQIVTSIVQPELVDADFRWFSPRKYLGTYQIINSFGLLAGGEEESGSIFSEVQYVTRYSYYTVVANPSKSITFAQNISIEDCNYFLVQKGITFPGTTGITEGYGFRDNANPPLIGQISHQKAELINQPFSQRISGIGLNLYAGVEGVSVNYTAEVINSVSDNWEPFPAPVCELGEQATCQQQFDGFTATSSFDLAPIDGVLYTSLAACLVAHPGLCGEGIWVCPEDSTVTYSYWFGQV